MKERPKYMTETLDWIPLKAMGTSMKLNRKTLEGGDFRLFTFTVLPYLKAHLPQWLYEKHHKKSVQALFNCSLPAFINACIKHFFGDSYLASEEKKMELLTKVRDYLFQEEKIKPRIIVPDKRRK